MALPLPRRRSSPPLAARSASHAQETGVGTSSSLPGDVCAAISSALGYGGTCGFCGWRPAGSGSFFPRRRWSSVAMPDLGAGWIGTRSRSMDWTAVGLIPSSMMGVSFDSTQSMCAMGFVQLEVLLGFFGGGDGRRRRCRALRFHKGARDLYVIFLLFGHLCEVGLGQVAPYIHRMCLYLYSMMYVFLI